MDLTEIRAGLRDQARLIVPNAYAYAIGTPASFPAVWVDMPDPIEKTSFQQNLWLIEFEVVLAVSDVWDRSAQQKVDELVVDLWPKLEADQTLDGAVSGSVFVREFRSTKSIENVPWIGGVFSVEVRHSDA